MAVVMIQEQPEMFRPEMYDKVNERIQVADNPPDGLIAHTVGQDDSGKWLIVDVWESREAHDRFAEERLRPAVREVLRENGMDPDQMPEPARKLYETYDVYPSAKTPA